MAFSASGNSVNVVKAVLVAKALGINMAPFLGESGGRLKKYPAFAYAFRQPKPIRFRNIIFMYHAICAQVERELFSKNSVY